MRVRVVVVLFGLLLLASLLAPRTVWDTTKEMVTDEMIQEVFSGLDGKCGISISHLAYESGTTWSIKPGEEAVVTDQKPSQRYFYHSGETRLQWAYLFRDYPAPVVQPSSVEEIIAHGHIKASECSNVSGKDADREI
jgi:hypothetical protein